MADTHETISDIIAEMRRNFADGNPYYAAGLPDRLEAAHRREIEATAAKCCQLGRLAGYGASEIKHQQEPVGDAAKLREALRECAQYIACVGGIGVGEVTINDNVHLIPEELTQKAIAALAAPPRNCDVGTAQEQDERFHRFCVKHHTGSCAGCHNPVGDYTVANGVRECALVWAQMPYEEGGAK